MPLKPTLKEIRKEVKRVKCYNKHNYMLVVVASVVVLSSFCCNNTRVSYAGGSRTMFDCVRYITGKNMNDLGNYAIHKHK